MKFFPKKGEKKGTLEEIPSLIGAPKEYPSILYRLNENTTCHKIDEHMFYSAIKNTINYGHMIQKLPICSPLFEEEFLRNKKYKDKNGIFHYSVIVFPSNNLELAQISYLVNMDLWHEQIKGKTEQEINELFPQINRGRIKLFSDDRKNLKSLADKLELPFDEKFVNEEKIIGLY